MVETVQEGKKNDEKKETKTKMLYLVLLTRIIFRTSCEFVYSNPNFNLFLFVH